MFSGGGSKQNAGFHYLSYSDRLARVSLYYTEGRLVRAGLTMVFNFLTGCCLLLGHLFVRYHNRDTRGHSFNPFVPCYNTDVRARFFSVRVIWNDSPESVVSMNSVNAYKQHIDTFLGQMWDFG